MAKTLFSNKKAYHEFTIVDKLEVGIVLYGWEVKSIKAGQGDFKGSFAVIDSNGQLWLRNLNVASWKTGQKQTKDAQKRDRKLLANKREIIKLAKFTERPGFTIVPLEIYQNERNLIKVQIAVVKGKKEYERKQVAKEKDMKQRMRRELREF